MYLFYVIVLRQYPTIPFTNYNVIITGKKKSGNMCHDCAMPFHNSSFHQFQNGNVQMSIDFVILHIKC